MKIDYQQIKKLIKEYYHLENGLHIKYHTELLRVCGEPDVYISRRALKHFVERRKLEFIKKYDPEESIKILTSILLNARHVLKSPNSVVIDETNNKIIYEKIFKVIPRLSIRIATELLMDKRQIKSLHLIKTKIPP